jgi:hypothetical protein
MAGPERSPRLSSSFVTETGNLGQRLGAFTSVRIEDTVIILVSPMFQLLPEDGPGIISENYVD